MELQNVAQQINQYDIQARSTADKAVELAKAAGELLLEVKASLPHGSFERWHEANLTVSVRQCQRYIAVARGETVPMRQLTGKSDTVSHLTHQPKKSLGVWRNDKWIPEAGFMYVFNEDDAAYWVQPAENGGIHVCKHYSGQRMSSEGFYWRYTVFGVNKDPDLASQFYVGTRHAPINPGCIHEILRSYGLKDLRGSLKVGVQSKDLFERPFGEPPSEDWYWDGLEPDDSLYQYAKSIGLVNQQGVVGYL